MFLTRLQAAAPVGSQYGGADFWFSPMTARTSSGMRVTPREAMALPAVFSCVKVLAESFAVMPFDLFRNAPDGRTKSKDRTHWLYKLFAKRPNRFQTPYEFRLMLQGHRVLRGNAFCQITQDGRGRITELLPLHPDRMAVEILPSGDYRYVYTRDNSEKIIYTRGEIWHLRGMSDDGIMGISPLEAEREAIGEGLAMQTYSARFFGNDARPPGYIEYPGQFKDNEVKRKWRDSWQEMQGGANRGKVAVLERGMKYHELGLKNVDAQFIEGRQLKAVDIARIFRVPPHKIAELTRATFSNIEQQSIEFWTDVMLPYAEEWESSIEYFLLGQGLDGPDEALEPEFDMDRMMRGDTAARAAYYASRTQWGSMTPNEAREREGDQPLAWLDHTMSPANMVRMDANGTHTPTGVALGDQAVQPSASRADNARLLAMASTERMRSLVIGNATRMARRLAGGQTTSAELLADALAIDAVAAEDWLAQDRSGLDETQIADQLMALALKGD